MYGDIINCLNPFCQKRFLDIILPYNIKLEIQERQQQDSRYYKLITRDDGKIIEAGFYNDCPFCWGTHTKNQIRISLNSSRKKTLMERGEKHERRDCWYCSLEGTHILDKYGCCIRCGTNLKERKKMEELPYPNELKFENAEQFEKQILGYRQQIKPLTIKERQDLHIESACNFPEKKESRETAIIKRGTSWETTVAIPIKYLIEFEYKPCCYEKEKKKSEKPDLKKIYISWRNGYNV